MVEDGAPLSGLRVADFGQYIAVPGATQILADLGADVIKVEPPEGDQARRIGTYGEAIMRKYNRRKRSVVIDLKDPAGQDTARALVRSADVVAQNLRPGAMERLGLGPEDVHRCNPRAVHLTVTGFGTAGPSARRPGLDIAAQAESGIMAATGEADREPQRVGFPVVDHATAYVGAQAVLAALLRRERTGRGGAVAVSLLDVALDLQSVNWGEYAVTGTEPVRKGNGQPAAAPAADVLPTADGAVVVSAYTEDRFAALCRAIGRPELIGDPRFTGNPQRVAHRPALLAELAAALAPLTSRRVVELLSRAGVVAGEVRSYAQARRAPDTVAGGLFTVAQSVGGDSYSIPGLPFVWNESPRSGAGGRVPALGEHTAEVMAALAAEGASERTA